MHAIKSAARRSAWYSNDDDEVKTYNFFGRTKPRKIRDEESRNNLTHTSTEEPGSATSATKRQKTYQEDYNQFGPPHHAHTSGDQLDEYPSQGSSHSKSRGLEQGFGAPPKANTYAMDEERFTSSEGSNEKANLENGAAQGGDVEYSAGPQNGDNKPRKRRLRKFWKKEEKDESGYVQRTDTTDSEKEKKKKKVLNPNITVMSQLRAVFLSWINILLVAVPVGIALNYAGVSKVVVFVVNFIAIIPLAAVLSYATEELALYIGETLGGLLNATFGNAVELIVSIIALVQGKVLIVQTSLIGSMLSNLLLVLGMCFFFGGLRRKEQFFNVTVAQTAASLLALAIGSLIIPTAFRIFSVNDKGVAPTSRGTAVLLLVTYGCYLFFQLRTHVDMYNEPSQKSPKKPSKTKEKGASLKALATSGASGAAAPTGGEINQENLVREEEEEEELPQLTRVGALLTLAGSTVLVALCAEFMVDGINAVAESVSQEFIGLILLPIVGNAAEHATAVTVAIKDKMDLAIGVAVGSSLQIALLVLPFTVMLSWWGVGPGTMTLNFDGFQVSVLFIAIIVVNYLIQDGKSHWLEGVLLQITYLIIAVAAWFYPVVGDVA